MSTSRRLLTALTALAAAATPLIVAAPAHAEITSPAAGSEVTEGPVVVSGAQPVGNKQVDRVTVTLTPDGGGSPISVVGCEGASCHGAAGDFVASFDLRTNGTYTAVAVAEHYGGTLDPAASSQTKPVSFGVAIPPAPPRRLVAEANGTNRTVTLSWTPNSEADIVGYQVFRSVDGGTFEQDGDPVTAKTTTFVDDAGDGGDLAYNVVALRRGATSNTLLASKASNTATVSVARTAPSTTTPSTSTTDGGTTASGGGATGTSGTTGTSGSGSSTTTAPGGLRPQTSSAPVRITPGARVDLSGFKPNQAPLNLGPAPTPDPGFKETLPYQTGTTAAPDTTVAEGDDQAALPVGSLTTTTTETNRRALLSFLAVAMLLFMLSMHLRWLLRRSAPHAQ